MDFEQLLEQVAQRIYAAYKPGKGDLWDVNLKEVDFGGLSVEETEKVISYSERKGWLIPAPINEFSDVYNLSTPFIEFCEKLNKPAVSSYIDQSVRIGNVSQSNVSALSSNVSQNLVLNPDASKIIEEITKTLRDHPDIAPETRADSLQDIESVRAELAKPKPNNRLLGFLLDNLDKVPQITAAIEALRGFLSN